MDVALGGTFDPVHDGHRRLFRRALAIGNLTIGLTTDELAPETRHIERYVRPYEQRRADLAAEVEPMAEEHGREVAIRPLEEPTGIATEPQFEYLVVSPETVDGAERINELRRERGHDELAIVVVPHLEAEDGEIVSSTRIVRGEIDEHGTLTPDASPREVPDEARSGST